MYVPKAFENNNVDELHKFMEKFNFSTLITQDKDTLHISHVPVMLDCTEGQYGTLSWHIAKLNPQVEALARGEKTVCIFHGPHAYISPTWYKSSPNVPTWNYTVVHAHGIPKKINNDQLAQDLLQMTNQHERGINRAEDYLIPDDYKLRLMNHIVGFRMEITQIEGAFKLSQNRSADDQNSMIENLRRQNTHEASTLVDFIESMSSLS